MALSGQHDDEGGRIARSPSDDLGFGMLGAGPSEGRFEIRQISDRPIVSNAPRQAIATESGLQSGFYSTSLLIRTSFQSDRIARVIVKHGQRMQSALPQSLRGP